MKVGLTGHSSAIGKAIKAELERQEHTAVLFGRNADTADVFFNLEKPQSVHLPTEVEALIHVAWSWASPEFNLLTTKRLLKTAKDRSVRFILLSTFAVNSRLSEYGAAKRTLESETLRAGGSTFRAGLIWGGEPARIWTSLALLARLPMSVSLRPDFPLHHSSILELGKSVVSGLSGEGGRAVLAAHKDTVSLNRVLENLRTRPPFGSIAFQTSRLLDGARWLRPFETLLPFRLDSLRSLDVIGPPADGEWANEAFKNSKALFDWLEGNKPKRRVRK